MNVNMQAVTNPFLNGMAGMGSMKSTQDRMERQQQCMGQVDFFEKQKENLKNMQCSSLEEIARKLEMFHSYEDQIAAAKKQFNNSQMSHILDEAKEIGEKIAKAAEEAAPKTPEERREDMAEEAMGTEENEGLMDELLEELEETVEEITEEVLEETAEELEEAADSQMEEEKEDLEAATGSLATEDAVEQFQEETMEKLRQQKAEAQAALDAQKAQKQQEGAPGSAVFRSEDMDVMWYRPFDYRV